MGEWYVAGVRYAGWMILHEAIGAMVGTGIGALRAGVRGEGATRALEVVAASLADHPSDLAETLAERLEPGETRDWALRGATLGVSALPLWDRLLLSRPGPIGDRHLVQAAVVATLGRPGADAAGWPAAEHLVPHYLKTWHPSGFQMSLPQDPGVLLGDVAALEGMDVDAVISLCRMGTLDVPADIDHVEVWFIDEGDSAANPNLAFVLRDVATTIGRLRDEEKRVFVHCVRAESRTPTAAAAYLAMRLGLSGSEALAITDELFPGPGPKPPFRSMLSDIFP